MNTKLDITLTDFIYAVVVGAAFQRIDAPIFNTVNLYLLVAFIVIIDDWVLYHVQAGSVNQGSSWLFAKSLVIDTIVLVIWYCAAVSGAHGLSRDFHFFLLLFYAATILWETAFIAHTKNSGRVASDVGCLILFAFGSVFCQETWYPMALPALAALWFACRAFAWKRLVFSQKVGDLA